jgi:hypothetical protein
MELNILRNFLILVVCSCTVGVAPTLLYWSQTAGVPYAWSRQSIFCSTRLPPKDNREVSSEKWDAHELNLAAFW